MQKLIYALLLTHLCACTFLIDSDVRSAQAIDSYLAAGNIWAANNYYEGLYETQKRGVAVSNAHVILTAKLSEIRKKTIDAAEAAVKVSDWKKAIDLYQEQLPLVEMDKAFNTSYQNFLKNQQRERNNLRDSFIVTRAEYLIDAIPVTIADQQLNPYNREKEQQLNNVKQESRKIASRLLELSFNAMRKEDIATARTMISLAKKLDDNEAAAKASKTLSTLSQSFDEHLEKMIEEGIQLYSREQYDDALRTWNEILFLDPENDKVKDHKARTQKILQSLEALKQQQS